jgi:methyl-accepting chemotaxis protein
LLVNKAFNVSTETSLLPSPLSTRSVARANEPASSASSAAHRPNPSSLGFFGYHGIWALGVRMFRSLRFVGKASIISAAFMVPVLTLAWFYFNATHESIAFSAKERLGVTYARDALPVLRAAMNNRLYAVAGAVAKAAPPELADARAKADAALAKLAATDKALGADLNTTKSFAALQAAASARDTGAEASAVFAAHTKFISALLAVLGDATDGSNLTLDPDVDSYYVMDAALFRLPSLIEGSGQMRGLGAAAIAAGVATPEVLRLINDTIPVQEYQFDNMVSGLAKSIDNNKSLAAKLKIDAVQSDTGAYQKLVRSTFNGEAIKGDRAAYVGAANKAIESQFEATERLLNMLDELVQARVDKLASNRNFVGITVLIFTLLAGYLFYCFALVTKGGFSELRRHLKAMTEGDLTTRPKPWGRDEAARMMINMAQMQTSLRALVAEVRASSEEIVTAATQISAGAYELSSRTEKAAASLEQTATAMEEISSTVRHTADNVSEADSLARQNSGVASQGGKVIGEAVTTMRDIQTSSSKIGDIIGVIDSIAFQTNILALNAAVEAARAGEQGRGFAVVATEVRALAQRSAAAAKEIKALIDESTTRVTSGTKVVEGAGTTMTQLVDNAQRMSGLLEEISTAAKEQSKGVSEVGKAVTVLDADTQQNAALVEETSAAVDALKAQAEGLVEQVARFKLP